VWRKLDESLGRVFSTLRGARRVVSEAGSGVGLDTWTVFVIQPLSCPVVEVEIVNDAVAPSGERGDLATDGASDPVYVPSEAEVNETRDGGVGPRMTLFSGFAGEP
jgi:hypothetical protein